MNMSVTLLCDCQVGVFEDTGDFYDIFHILCIN